MSDEQQESLSARIVRLTVAASTLSTTVAQNSDAIESLTRRAKLAERFIAIISVSLIMDISLTIAVALLAYQNYTTNSRLATLCPLYAFTVGTYAPASRTAGPARDQYVQSFTDMRIKFEQLGCGPDYPIVPGAAHPPTAAPTVGN